VEGLRTNAAVAANISTLPALVIRAIQSEKIMVKAQTSPSLVSILSTKNKAIIETVGIIDDTTEPRT
jgi:hypothetical protein